MSLRVLHLGNIANNAYVLARALRRLHGVEADVYTRGYAHYISQPEWEDADVEVGRFEELGAPDWDATDLGGFQRPAWYFEHLTPAVLSRLAGSPLRTVLRVADLADFGFEAEHGREVLREALTTGPANRRIRRSLLDLHAGLAVHVPRRVTDREWHRALIDSFRESFAAHPPRLTQADIDHYARRARELRPLFAQYDIIQAYGVWEPLYPLLATPTVPRVNFEHGSLREHPFSNEPAARLMLLAYRTAERNVITNADAIQTVRRLDLPNCTFIPHPVDDTKFRPGRSPIGNTLRAELECTQILLAPARQNWRLKGNDRFLRAFARVNERLDGRVVLMASAWGDDLERSVALATELGVRDRVVWLPPLPKRRLADYIRASDAVLDQFTLGVFGTVTPEALACGKPTLLHFDAQHHDWCFPVPPPVVSAQTAEEIEAALLEVLDDPARAEALASASHSWYVEHHSIDLVARRHLEIYESIRSSRRIVQVPPDIPVRVAYERAMRARVVALVRCPAPSRNSKGEPRFLRPIAGEPVLRVLARRLASIPAIKHVALVMDEREPATEDAARSVGWNVICRHPRRARDGLTALAAARSDYLAFFNLENPFIDREAFEWLLRRTSDRRLKSVRMLRGHSALPSRLLHRSLAAAVGLLRFMLRGSQIGWRDGLEAVLPHVEHEDLEPPFEEPHTNLKADDVPSFIVEAVGGPEFRLADLQRLESDSDLLRDVLYAEMQRSDVPHLVNAQLNNLEARRGYEELLSFPPTLGLNMTSVCNATCTFCSYQPRTQKHRDFVGIADLRKMDWLKYVKQLAVWGGVGDSLVNREFLDGFRYLRSTHPHLEISLFTNGSLMTQEHVEAFVGGLAHYNVSLNAATAPTWEKVMRTKGFERVCDTYAALSTLRRQRQCRWPRLSMSMVLTRDNLHEAVRFVDLAHALGADEVSYCHYVPTTLKQHRDLDPTGSCYHAPEETDETLAAAKRRAVELGIACHTPLPFSAEASHINRGERTGADPGSCEDPWRTCYLTVDEDGRRQLVWCCSGFYFDIEYQKGEQDEATFKRLWNHPTIRYFRRTVNQGDNPVCTFCQTNDRFDPGKQGIYDVYDAVQPAFHEVADRAASGEVVDPGDLLAREKIRILS